MIIFHFLNIFFVLRFLALQSNSLILRKQNANSKCRKGGKHVGISFRSLKKVDTIALIADLNRIPWSILETYSNDPGEMLNTWIKLVLDVVDTHTACVQ